jgi:hypothetical protein
MEHTPVVFRVWKGDDSDIFALFPTIDGSVGFCSCYQHIGQHGSADYTRCIMQSRPATPSEYEPLLAELVSIGYDDLKVYARRPPR